MCIRSEDVVRWIYWAVRFIMFLFTVAIANFEIFVIVSAVDWLRDFDKLSGHNSDWNWTVAILTIAAFRVAFNAGESFISFQDWNKMRKAYSPTPMNYIGLCFIAVVDLIPSAIYWVHVRPRNWADVLRQAGHADHADNFDKFVSFQEAVIIFMSIIAGIAAINLLVFLVVLVVTWRLERIDRPSSRSQN
ncbi:hypothetical protein Z517_09210 [Fonsecaea pedrosoi CBS 271.37]|uniref:Uncharacterized protein n=1 Tax=Fonsecaea pedrosoi CBS 271.37 TaxID=1442368 RepID=A0A0D2DGF7_9EURO|nr:uncharacterized protein Z517_09210 [Fonsecaea pedrosoi CBS 271.37]KIW76766.1 hypothetical protein Z517_09210 [Fonsecaea pedrosoi CBS 271.37]